MRVVFFSGSGLSADSGVPTFRGKDGLYSGMRAEDVLSSLTFARRPGVVHAFLDDFRQLLGDKAPNRAHGMIAAWQERFPDDTDVLTMNVDALLEAAGCADVAHLHGELSRMRSVGNSHVVVDIGHASYWDGPPGTEPSGTVLFRGEEHAVAGHRFRCPVTGSLFRPDVVLFGEDVRLRYRPYYAALRRLGPCDALVAIGTEGSVVPICRDTRGLNCLKILVNPHRHDPRWVDESAWDRVVRRPAAEAVDEVLALLEEWRTLGAGRAVTGGGRAG